MWQPNNLNQRVGTTKPKKRRSSHRHIIWVSSKYHSPDLLLRCLTSHIPRESVHRSTLIQPPSAGRSRSTLTPEPTCLLLLQQYFVIACLVNEVSRCSEGKRVKWALLSLNELVNSVLAQRKASCFRRGLLPPCRCLRSPTGKVFRWTWKYAVYVVEGLPRDFTMVRQPATHVELFLGEGHCHIKK